MDKLVCKLTAGGNNLTFGLEEENGLTVKMGKEEYVNWKRRRNPNR